MTTPGFLPTHVVPPDGLPAWESPDPAHPTVALDALLPVQLLERRGDWGRVLCANGWSAWVDGRLLVAVPQDPPAAGAAHTRTADPRPLLARAEEALTRYRTEAEALAAGHRDGESFRERTKGLRIGVVVDGESLWLFDAAHERWVYCDGTRLSTFAAVDEPRETPAAPRFTPAAAPAPAPASAPTPTRAPSPASSPAPEPTPTRAPAPATSPEPTRVVGEPVREPTDRRAADPSPAGPRPATRPADRGPSEDEPTRLVPPVTRDE
ncbi:hypothetical protein [Streptomyces sp. 11x1]|uniref:hypothetical protein n=1 Tax=Streptomyces sp. 11x1 TaxID=3038642 RepID=UPI00292EBB05|nr:hypothetical protein [Streptomyces sp. 11x1]WNZ14056.1 hypothetical protein P8T65_45215 [Streptomyces sp. 11x1]